MCSCAVVRRFAGHRAPLRIDERLSLAVGRQVPEASFELLAGERSLPVRAEDLVHTHCDRWFERRARLLVRDDVIQSALDFEHVANLHHEPVHDRVYGQSIQAPSSLAPSSISRLRFRCLYSPASSPIQLTVFSCGSTIRSSSTPWVA